MRFCFVAFIALLGLALTTGPVQAQPIPVSIPNLTDQSGEILIPVNVETAIDEKDNIISYEFGIKYDPEVLYISNVETEGTLSEGLDLSFNSSPSGFFSVTVANASGISGEAGPLVHLVAQILPGATGNSPLTFDPYFDLDNDDPKGDRDAFSFNEGIPASIITSGNVSTEDLPPNANLIINEIHADPASGNAGDANNDGTRSSDDDEFIEIINAGSSPIDISGYTIFDAANDSPDNDTLRFTFPPNTTLAPNTATVVFGGGSPNGIPGLVFTTGSLDLNDDGDTVTLKDSNGKAVTTVTYAGDSDSFADQSITRSPDIEGSFALHIEASPEGELYSPGRTLEGDNLPVELNSFDAVLDGQDVVLRWSTASETNNSGFNVQQRVDGAFENLVFVEGAGLSTSTVHYSHRVSGLEPGTYAFRLEQVDDDGSTTLSREVEVSVPVESAFVLESAYPNPFQTQASFTLRVRETQEVTVTLFNALGQRVREVFAGTVRAGVSETFTIDGASLPSGMYLYRVQGRTFSASKQITRVK